MGDQETDIPNAKEVEVWAIGCIMYYDQLGKQHGTSFVYLYFTDNNTSRFKPDGTIHGTFVKFDLSKSY